MPPTSGTGQFLIHVEQLHQLPLCASFGGGAILPLVPPLFFCKGNRDYPARLCQQSAIANHSKLLGLCIIGSLGKHKSAPYHYRKMPGLCIHFVTVNLQKTSPKYRKMSLIEYLNKWIYMKLYRKYSYVEWRISCSFVPF